MFSIWPNDKILKKINRILLVIIIGCNLFVLGAPILPQLQFGVSNIGSPVKIDSDFRFSEIDRNYNHIVIPKLKLDEKINEGIDISAANTGTWRRPNTSSPGNGSNTVIVGHRFTYDGASVFYHLDKLQNKDEVIVVWDKQIYVYTVNSESIVPATAVEIEYPTENELLTIYTCTPLWSAKDRLVITARLERKLI